MTMATDSEAAARLTREALAFLAERRDYRAGVVAASRVRPALKYSRAVVVLACSIAHDPTLDHWGAKGGNRANWELMCRCRELSAWFKERGVRARRLSYQVERRGIYLKDAAALCGVGVMGRNNLLLVPELGPRVRLLSVAVRADMAPTPALAWNPCDGCDAPCLSACPRKALEGGAYSRLRCARQMAVDEQRGDPLVAYCRRCEERCVVGG